MPAQRARPSASPTRPARTVGLEPPLPPSPFAQIEARLALLLAIGAIRCETRRLEALAPPVPEPALKSSG